MAHLHRARADGRARPDPDRLRRLRPVEGVLVGRLDLGPDDRVHGGRLVPGLVLAAQQDAVAAGQLRAERPLDRARPAGLEAGPGAGAGGQGHRPRPAHRSQTLPGRRPRNGPGDGRLLPPQGQGSLRQSDRAGSPRRRRAGVSRHGRDGGQVPAGRSPVDDQQLEVRTQGRELVQLGQQRLLGRFRSDFSGQHRPALRGHAARTDDAVADATGEFAICGSTRPSCSDSGRIWSS